MTKYIVFISICLLSLGACKDKTGITAQQSQAAYFNLDTYIDQEIARLKDASATGSKTGMIAHKADHKMLSFSELESDLEKIKDMNIDKPAWKNGFSTDTSLASHRITYKAKDLKIPVRFLEIDMDSSFHHVKRIKAVSHTSTNLYSLTRSITYIPGRTAEFVFIQHVIGMNDQTGWVRINIKN